MNKMLLGISLLMCAIVRTEYIRYTPAWLRQHDVIGFGNTEGQAAFIEYFYHKYQPHHDKIKIKSRKFFVIQYNLIFLQNDKK